MFNKIIGWTKTNNNNDDDDSEYEFERQEMVYQEVKGRLRSDSIYSEYNEEDYDDGDVDPPIKPHGAATFASYMNLTNTCIGAVRKMW